MFGGRTASSETVDFHRRFEIILLRCRVEQPRFDGRSGNNNFFVGYGLGKQSRSAAGHLCQNGQPQLSCWNGFKHIQTTYLGHPGSWAVSFLRHQREVKNGYIQMRAVHHRTKSLQHKSKTKQTSLVGIRGCFQQQERRREGQMFYAAVDILSLFLVACIVWYLRVII